MDDAVFSEFDFDLLKQPFFDDSDPNFERLIGIGFEDTTKTAVSTAEKNFPSKTANSTPIFNFSEAQ